jgi:lipoate-protein ligase A
LLYVNNQDILDPAINLAIEEYVLKELNINETYLMFYRMEPSIIVGKNQNTIEEMNMDYVKGNSVHVVRRLSGGGAVYNDQGNLSFSFITKDDGESFHNYEIFTKPVIRALHKMGVNAELSGRNDIVVDGKKVSGNAQFSTKGKMYSHGTLLFDVNLENVAAALNVNPEKYQSKGIKSVRSRVTNIREHLDEDMRIHDFRKTLLAYLFENDEAIPEYKLTDKDWKKINELVKSRYKNWDWNYGKSPTFNVKQSKRFQAGTIDARFQVKKGVIEEATIFGDFFGVGDVSEVEQRLIGTQYERAALESALDDVDTKHYFGNITKEAFLDLLYNMV